MTRDDFFAQTYKWEKGLVNDPDDPGGWTNDGITYTYYLNLCQKVLGKKPSSTHFPKMTMLEKMKLYNYMWFHVGLDKITSIKVAGVCYDFIFNSAFAQREIQEVLISLGYKITADNDFGDKTYAAINDAVIKVGEATIIKMIIQKRKDYVVNLSQANTALKKFLKGWLNRINDLEKFVK